MPSDYFCAFLLHLHEVFGCLLISVYMLTKKINHANSSSKTGFGISDTLYSKCWLKDLPRWSVLFEFLFSHEIQYLKYRVQVPIKLVLVYVLMEHNFKLLSALLAVHKKREIVAVKNICFFLIKSFLA